MINTRSLIATMILTTNIPSLFLNVLNEAVVPCLATGITGREPLGALHRVAIWIRVHGIHILQRQTLGLEQEEVHQRCGGKIRSEKDKTEGVRDTAVRKRCQEGNHEVAEPVACCGERSLFGSSAKWECFADDDPSHRTPSHGKGGDEHACSHDHHDTRCAIVLRIECCADCSEDAKPCSLPQSADEHWSASSISLHDVQAWERRDDVDRTKNELRNDGILNTCGREDRRTVLRKRSDCKRRLLAGVLT